jgi:hypothetical protein
MAYIPDFDLDDIVGILTSVSEGRMEGSKAKDALELAQIALLYTRHLRKQDDFIRYYKEFYDPSFKIRIAQEFATREGQRSRACQNRRQGFPGRSRARKADTH